MLKKIAKLRASKELQEIKKSGKNTFAGFNYFELADFLPIVSKLENDLGLVSVFNLTDTTATLEVLDVESKDKITFTSPIAEANMKGALEIQKLGSQHTYLKRYLYLNYLNLTENDTVDSIDQKSKVDVKTEKASSKVIAEIEGLLTPERLQTMLNHYGVENLNDLTKEQGEEALKILKK